VAQTIDWHYTKSAFSAKAARHCRRRHVATKRLVSKIIPELANINWTAEGIEEHDLCIVVRVAENLRKSMLVLAYNKRDCE